jgi:HEAT repeat protein
VKINMSEFNQYLGGLSHNDSGNRHNAVTGLAKYSDGEWEGSPDAAKSAIKALVDSNHRRTVRRFDRPFWATTAKVLGNIGAQSPAVVPELVRLLHKDLHGEVRTEAALSLGKIGTGAKAASGALTLALSSRGSGDTLRGAVAWALVRVAPELPSTAEALRTAAHDRSGHVGVCAAEALSKLGDVERAVPALAARLYDRKVRDAAVQALYRIGPKTKGAIPSLLAALKDGDRLYRESVVMALKKIDPEAAAKVGLG